MQSEHISVSGSTPAVSGSLSESLSGLDTFIRDLVNDIVDDVDDIVVGYLELLCSCLGIMPSSQVGNSCAIYSTLWVTCNIKDMSLLGKHP